MKIAELLSGKSVADILETLEEARTFILEIEEYIHSLPEDEQKKAHTSQEVWVCQYSILW